MAKVTPIPRTPWTARHLWEIRRHTLIMICVSVALMGVGEGLLVQAALGSTPWTVFAQGISIQTGMPVGISIALISVAVLLLWVPLHLRFGLGTLVNVVLIALFVDLTMRAVPAPQSLPADLLMVAIGILIFGISTAFYLSCRLGAGPRDGLMVGICQKFGWPVGRVRTALEMCVALFGALLGGKLGWTTVIFALSVGWVIQAAMVLLIRHYQDYSD